MLTHQFPLLSAGILSIYLDADSAVSLPVCRYPVILSIENHCSIKQQQAMAHYLKTLLGDKLYTDNVDTSLNGMPSPETLKGKILVKVCSIP